MRYLLHFVWDQGGVTAATFQSKEDVLTAIGALRLRGLQSYSLEILRDLPDRRLPTLVLSLKPLVQIGHLFGVERDMDLLQTVHEPTSEKNVK